MYPEHVLVPALALGLVLVLGDCVRSMVSLVRLCCLSLCLCSLAWKRLYMSRSHDSNIFCVRAMWNAFIRCSTVPVLPVPGGPCSSVTPFLY